jgi:HAD superfamily hydrolase (TIGR01459 family)
MRPWVPHGWRGAASAMRIDGLGQIAASYGGMLIDQFGVVHDGQKLYPHVLDALARLHDAGIPAAILTNSGKRAAANEMRIVSMGVPRDHFIGVVSSGEVAAANLPRKKAYIVGRDGEDYGFDTVTVVEDVRDAEILLILGSNAPRTSREDYCKMFSGLAIPAICCNPDKLMLTRDGLQPAPGAIAALYREMGGEVTWIGKPYPEIYAYARKLIGNPERVLCIGDSAEHDVAGGRNAGLDTLLVMTGISTGLDPAQLHPEPHFIMDEFKW